MPRGALGRTFWESDLRVVSLGVTQTSGGAGGRQERRQHLCPLQFHRTHLAKASPGETQCSTHKAPSSQQLGRGYRITGHCAMAALARMARIRGGGRHPRGHLMLPSGHALQAGHPLPSMAGSQQHLGKWKESEELPTRVLSSCPGLAPATFPAAPPQRFSSASYISCSPPKPQRAGPFSSA